MPRKGKPTLRKELHALYERIEERNANFEKFRNTKEHENIFVATKEEMDTIDEENRRYIRQYIEIGQIMTIWLPG